MFYDNMSALHIPINPMFHKYTKHIELEYHYFVHEKVAIEALVAQFAPLDNQIDGIPIKSPSSNGSRKHF